MTLDECYLGDVRDGLRAMIAAGVRARTCVTSPPYWGLRDYGTASWDGGDSACDHLRPIVGKNASSTLNASRAPDGTLTGHANSSGVQQYRESCAKCGARRIDRQLGLEPTIDEYVANMVEVFRLVRDVIADDGTLWLNIGDSYAASSGTGGTNSFQPKAPMMPGYIRKASGALKPKDLCMVPARVALALQADGWWLRQDIIWHKPNPMPESIRDRCTKAHEYLFLLSKRERYYYDADAIAEPAINAGRVVEYDGEQKNCETANDPRFATRITSDRTVGDKRNRRSVWTIATEAYRDAHFAVMPTALVEPCILAGTSSHGRCAKCGAAWMRAVHRTPATVNAPRSDYGHGAGRNDGGRSQLVGASSETLGWGPSCDCGSAAGVVPDVVLDPFMGSGTVAQVAQSLGRRWVGCELNPEYHAMQGKRAAQRGLTLA